MQRININLAVAHIGKCIVSVGDPKDTLLAMYRQLDACEGMVERFAKRYSDDRESDEFYYSMRVALFDKRRAVEKAVLAAQLRSIKSLKKSTSLSLKNFCLR
jgi:hypothetical protein